MAASRASNQRVTRPHLPVAEKRRIVELTLREGASIRAIAHEHGISRNSLRRWQVLYHVGKLAGQPASSVRIDASRATFLPVRIAPTADGGARNVVELRLSSGAMLRIETTALESELIRTLLAQLRR